jgi:hypothetical protein
LQTQQSTFSIVFSAEDVGFFVNRIGHGGGERSGDFGGNKKG